MQTLTEQEMLEIKGGDWTGAAKGSLWAAAIILTIYIVSQGRHLCRLILSGCRDWWKSGNQR